MSETHLKWGKLLLRELICIESFALSLLSYKFPIKTMYRMIYINFFKVLTQEFPLKP